MSLPNSSTISLKPNALNLDDDDEILLIKKKKRKSGKLFGENSESEPEEDISPRSISPVVIDVDSASESGVNTDEDENKQSTKKRRRVVSFPFRL